MNKRNFAYLLTGVVLLLFVVISWWVSREPAVLVIADTEQHSANQSTVGYTTTTALIKVTETLLDKPGGYLANDILPPYSLLDNMPAWEFGVLEMSRDLALAFLRRAPDAAVSRAARLHGRDLSLQGRDRCARL